jgi:hypothetical protein
MNTPHNGQCEEEQHCPVPAERLLLHRCCCCVKMMPMAMHLALSQTHDTAPQQTNTAPPTLLHMAMAGDCTTWSMKSAACCPQVSNVYKLLGGNRLGSGLLLYP